MVDKQRIVDAFRAHLTERWVSLTHQITAAADGTRVDDDHRPTNRGERAAVSNHGYLAHGLAARAAQLQDTLDVLTRVNLEGAQLVRTGALVYLSDDDENEQAVFILPGGQGDSFDGVSVISPQAPLARALWDREGGDEVVVARAGRSVRLTVLSVE